MSIKCAYYNCDQTNDDTSMFRFPVKDPIRAAIWKRNSGNTYLDTLPPQKLRNRYLCSTHFAPSSIHRAPIRDRLIGPAVPICFSAADEPCTPPSSETLKVMTPMRVYSCKQRMSPTQSKISRESSGAEPSNSKKKPQPSQLAQRPRPSKCSLCSKNFTGFVFVCVQCDVRACSACDARDTHARHYVLRAPSDGPEEQLEEVLRAVRAAVLAAGLAPQTPCEPEPEPQEEEDTDDEEEEIILKSEIKEELDWGGSEDPLASEEYEETYARDSTDSAAGSQIVPVPDNVKQEPPDDSSAILDTGSDATIANVTSRRQSDSSNDSEDQPLARKRRRKDIMDRDIKVEDENKTYTDPNSNPGSPSIASSLTRRKNK